jgi:hypothetical protein
MVHKKEISCDKSNFDDNLKESRIRMNQST